MNLQAKLDDWRSQDPALLLGTVNQRLPFWVSLALVVVIAWYSAQIVWALVPPPAVPPMVMSMSAPGDAGQSASGPPAYAGIVDTHIFGESSDDTEAPVIQNTENVPETRLNLTLHGAIRSSDPAQAHAIISEKGKSSEVYFTGDPIPGGAKLHEVQMSQVIINRGGVLETLKLPEIARSSAPAPRAPAQARRNFGPRTVRQNSDQSEPDSMARFTDIVRPQPYMPNGTLKGYRLYPGRDRKTFAAMGLRPGDLVTDINGVPLNDMSQGMTLFQSLGDATQLTVTIERNGNPQVLNLDTTAMVNKDDNQR